MILVQSSGENQMMIFDELWANWPTEDRATLFGNLGGGWPALLKDPIKEKSYRNTCTIRFSVALARTGRKIPQSFSDGGHKDKNGNYIAIRVATARELAKNFFGDSFWGESHIPGTPINTAGIPAQKGLLIYLVPANDANGHVDLWRTNACRVDCHAEFAAHCHEIQLWKLP
jgi:hypothetical protein